MRKNDDKINLPQIRQIFPQIAEFEGGNFLGLDWIGIVFLTPWFAFIQPLVIQRNTKLHLEYDYTISKLLNMWKASVWWLNWIWGSFDEFEGGNFRGLVSFLFSGSPQLGKRFWWHREWLINKARIRGELGSRFGNQAYRDLRWLVVHAVDYPG